MTTGVAGPRMDADGLMHPNDMMRADMARLDTSIAQRDAEAAKRETRLILAILGAVALATTILGVLITTA